ncbi:MAG: hypothetical protein ACKPKO_48980, partial [Candidatus Fonsibacter sp.]
MLLATFRPHRDALQEAFVDSCHPSLVDKAVVAEWTYNVIVDALIRLSTVPTEEMEPHSHFLGFEEAATLFPQHAIF